MCLLTVSVLARPDTKYSDMFYNLIGSVLVTISVYKYFSLLNAAEIVGFLASFGSMAIGLGCLAVFAFTIGIFWHKYWVERLRV